MVYESTKFNATFNAMAKTPHISAHIHASSNPFVESDIDGY